MADRNTYSVLGEHQQNPDEQGDAENQNPNANVNPTPEQMAATIVQLQQRIAQLDVQAATAVRELQAQVQLAQGNATAAAHLSQRPTR